MVRRFQEMEEDAHDEYARYQQEPGKRPKDVAGRYELTRPSLRSLQTGIKAKFLTVYTNGEKYIFDKPVQISFKIKTFPKLESLLDEIARSKERINKTLVRYLFKWPSGQLVTDVTDIHEDDETTMYVCSDNMKLYRRGRYGETGFAGPGDGGSDGSGRNSYESRGNVRSNKVSPVRRSRVSMNGGKGHHIQIISNTNRNSRQGLFLDPKSNLPFEEILRNVTEMLDMENPPCRALYSLNPPFKKVDSISSLNRIIPMYGDTFIACGQEEPTLPTRDVSPVRNGGKTHRMQNGEKRPNGQKNERRDQQGSERKSEVFEDAKGREFQRFQEEQDQEEEAEDGEEEVAQTNGDSPRQRSASPRREPPHAREDKRRQPPPTQKQEDASLQRRVEKGAQGKKAQNGNQKVQKASMTSRDMEPEGNDRKRNGVGDGADSEWESRGSSPSEREMAKRIEDMEEIKKDLDEDVEY
ncbi:hypothetical protein DPMN_094728 [Dreissena polymorpha]|uniref:Doublecortin domain-containing protein n=1 Tax=Dreissena polymorpha TaxID=45954 RepID=A0A9D4R339_DREPO|nr:hypothetical protein DPMN_094728 [Dreissena polymorpha]